MKTNTIFASLATDHLIAAFGEARLIRREGEVCLLGGSMSDRTEALEWLMMFLPAERVRIR
jgi:hypothetical protein